MHKYLLAAVAAAAIASPAAARDGQAYVGVEGGLVLANHEDFDVDLDYGAGAVGSYDNADVHFRPGADLDVIAGYDFGMFRLEGELAWKSLHTRDIGENVGAAVTADLEDFYDLDSGTFEDEFGADADLFLGVPDHATVLSLMGSALVDFELGGFGAYAGVGAGRARVKMFDDKDQAWAFQGILGARAPISDRVDFGLKYRYFRTGRVNFNTELLSPEFYGGDAVGFNGSGRISTHSILASLIFNLGTPAAEPMPVIVDTPPPPPAPATQTCPDGSVILATDVCPAPPPPPPAPSGERG
jgi:OmpA-OmpF porin, OOP family